MNIGDSVLIKGEITRLAEDMAEVGVWLEAEKLHGWFKLSELTPVEKGCVVKEVCLSAEKRGECRKCKKWSKFERKKSESRQATGRSNKRKGHDSEKKLLLHFQRQGIPARIIEGSGAYKKSREGADSDLRVTILDKERKVENKKYGSKASALAKIRSLIGEKGILYITDFCCIMDENVFYDIVKNRVSVGLDKNGTIHAVSTAENTYRIKEVSDRNYGWLHNFFNQDFADIVSLDESYKDFLFCLQPVFFKEVIEGGV